MKTRGTKQFLLYGISSGALRAALFAQRHPERVKRLAPYAFVWAGGGGPPRQGGRRRHPPGPADDATIEAFAEAILALDDSVPTGTYVDMCAKLPVVEPERIPVP